MLVVNSGDITKVWADGSRIRVSLVKHPDSFIDVGQMNVRYGKDRITRMYAYQGKLCQYSLRSTLRKVDDEEMKSVCSTLQNVEYVYNLDALLE